MFGIITHALHAINPDLVKYSPAVIAGGILKYGPGEVIRDLTSTKTGYYPTTTASKPISERDRAQQLEAFDNFFNR